MGRGSFLKGHKVLGVNVDDKETTLTLGFDEGCISRGESFKFVTKILDNGEKIQYYLYKQEILSSKMGLIFLK